MLLDVQKVGNIINFTVSEDLLGKYNNFKPCCYDNYVYIYTISHCFKILYFKGAKMQFCITEKSKSINENNGYGLLSFFVLLE